MNTTILPEVVVSAIPAKQLYWQGFDQYTDCAASGDYLSPEELAAMTPQEKRGYEYAQRCAADCETAGYLRYNTNAFGDTTQAASF